MANTVRIGLLVMMLSALLAGCGYHLRGSTGGTWNLGRLFVQNPTQVGAEVQRLLSLSGVSLVGSPADSDAILSFTREEQQRRVLSVDPDTGKVREYELVVDTGVTVVTPAGMVLMEDDSIALQREYVFDETAALGAYEQEATLFIEMRKDLAAAIVRRLQALRLPVQAEASAAQ